jgi:hypothetical protein
MELDLTLGDIWVYLSATPLLHLTLTLLAYLFGDWIFLAANHGVQRIDKAGIRTVRCVAFGNLLGIDDEGSPCLGLAHVNPGRTPDRLRLGRP